MILQLDINGRPQNWIPPEAAATYYATDSVSWTVGEVCASMRGGMNAVTGRQSQIDIHPIIALNGAAKVNLFDAVPALTNAALFKRDRWTCAYCASVHKNGVGLTREHIHPRARGGADTFLNTVAACRGCNGKKACRRPEEAGMTLLFAPYNPTIFESFLLKGRNIGGDVHSWLASRVGKNSRWYEG